MGNRQRAQEHRITVTAMYCEMDVQFWLDKTDAGISGA
jgi:hypothetical protein